MQVEALYKNGFVSYIVDNL